MDKLKEVDNLYSNFRTKQNAVEKFKDYLEELVRKNRELTHFIENNFESLERDFYEIQRGPKKVLEAAELWSNLANQKMDKFGKITAQDVKGDSAEYIAFDMLEDPNNPEDIIKMGEKVLEDLADHSDLPVNRIQDQLETLARQIDQHLKSKVLVMLDILNNIVDSTSAPVGIPALPKKTPLEKYSTDKFQAEKSPINKFVAEKPVNDKYTMNLYPSSFKAETNKSNEISKPASSPLAKTQVQKPKEAEPNLLEDDNDLLEDLSLNDKVNENDFLDQIPDAVEHNEKTELDPSDIGNTDKAYDVISQVLENELDNLDLSNRKLGDEFFESMIESIIDFAEGAPLSVVNLNLSGNNISDTCCDKL